MQPKGIVLIAAMFVFALAFVASPATAKDDKKDEKCISFHFVYDDGHEDKDTRCDGKKDIEEDIHVESLHLSCSDKFEGGEGQKSDLDGHKVEAWEIVHFKGDEVKKRCGPGVPEEPECPEDLSVEALKTGDIQVSWTPNEGSDGFSLYRQVGDGEFVKVAELPGNATGYLDTDTTVGQSYTYALALHDGRQLIRCGQVETTAIPVFPSMLAGIAAVAASVGGYVFVRRRK